MSCLENEVRERVAIISDAFTGILHDVTRSALITDEEMDELLWIDEQLSIEENELEEDIDA